MMNVYVDVSGGGGGGDGGGARESPASQPPHSVLFNRP